MTDNRVLAIEGKIDRDQTGALAISGKTSAVAFEKLGDMMDFARLMAVSDVAIPKYLRGNIGACLAIVVQANEWGLSPFSVARMSFNVGDTIGYFAQLLHAVVERRAPIKQRLRFEYAGEGQDRQVTVTGHFKGEIDPVTYVSPKVKDIRPKNSPLWVSDTDQQLSYMGSRAWARRYCPDVLLGVYSADELDDTRHVGAENAKDITPETEGLQHRLSAKAAAGAGFDPSGIAATLNEASGKVASQNSTVAVAGTVAQTAVSEPPTPVGVVETAVDLSPGGDASAHGGQAPETAATTSSPVAAVEPPKRRGRPPKAAAAPVEPAAEPTAPDTEQDDVPPADPESPVESAPQEHVPPAHEDVVGLAPATSEGAVSDDLDDDLPDSDIGDRVPDPPAQPLPETPTDARYFCGYLRKVLMQPTMKVADGEAEIWFNMQDEAQARAWWNHMSQKRFRNGLPNYTNEIAEKAKGIVTEHLRALKEGT